MLNNKLSNSDYGNAYNTTDAEHIYAWDNNEMRIRDDETVCPGCNSYLPSSSDPLDKPDCKNRRCNSCGYTVKLYGFDEAGYVDTYDDTDFEGAPERHIERQQPIDQTFSRKMWKPKMGRKVRFANDDDMM